MEVIAPRALALNPTTAPGHARFTQVTGAGGCEEKQVLSGLLVKNLCKI